MIRRAAAAVLCLALVLCLCGFSPAPKRYQAEFFGLFDTVTTLVGYAPDRASFTALAQKTQDLLREYHELYDIFNTYHGVANLKTVNDTAARAPVQVDPRIIDLIEFSRALYEETGSAVNIAMGAVLRIWHEARLRGVDNPAGAAVPDMDVLRRAAEHTNLDDVIVDREQSTVYFADPYLRLDVGAVAKGFAVEQVARRLEEAGVKNLLISVGGNVRAIGGKPDGAREIPWAVSVRNPNGTEDLCTVNVFSSSVVTSGGYIRRFTVAGEEYHHIISPETLMPSRHFLGVTVRCRDSGLADALSTALFNLPWEAGCALSAKMPEVEVLWVFPDGNIRTTAGFFAVETGAAV
jgi:thiamine biosynthesis lipoprotein